MLLVITIKIKQRYSIPTMRNNTSCTMGKSITFIITLLVIGTTYSIESPNLDYGSILMTDFEEEFNIYSNTNISVNISSNVNTNINANISSNVRTNVSTNTSSINYNISPDQYKALHTANGHFFNLSQYTYKNISKRNNNYDTNTDYEWPVVH